MNLKRLAEISPVIGAFLIFIGYLKLHLYYNHWGINIANYLDFSEIILAFLNDTNTIFFFIIILLLQMTISVGTLQTIDNKITASAQNRNNNAPNSTSQFPGILPAIENAIEENHKPVVIALAILTVIFLVLFLYFLNLIFLYLTFMVFIQLLILFLDNILGVKDEKSLMQVSFVVILLGFTYCLAKYDIKQIELSPKQMTVLRNNDEAITTSNEFIFIGKTNNYYFFFDKIKNQSTIIQGESVLQAKISN